MTAIHPSLAGPSHRTNHLPPFSPYFYLHLYFFFLFFLLGLFLYFLYLSSFSLTLNSTTHGGYNVDAQMFAGVVRLLPSTIGFLKRPTLPRCFCSITNETSKTGALLKLIHVHTIDTGILLFSAPLKGTYTIPVYGVYVYRLLRLEVCIQEERCPFARVVPPTIKKERHGANERVRKEDPQLPSGSQ